MKIEWAIRTVDEGLAFATPFADVGSANVERIQDRYAGLTSLEN
jgi:hypothetical protein